jgi:hypothetical protein
MSLNHRRIFVFLVIALLLISGGCITSKKKKTEKRVYVKPCNVASKGLQIRIGSNELNTKSMREHVIKVFVDDFDSPSGGDMLKTLTVDCYWGSKVGENRDLYYCSGKYKAPQMDEARIIKQHVWKNYKIGFSVEKHDIGTWVDSSGKIHKEEAVYYLQVKDVRATCWRA